MTERPTCSVEGCSTQAYSRGLCGMHYRRLLRTGFASDAGLKYPPDQPGHSNDEAASKVGVTYRQLDHWVRSGYVAPTLVDAIGSGHRRRWSDNDLLKLACLAGLRGGGVELETAAGLLRQIEAEDIDLENVEFVIADGIIRPRERVA